MSREEIISYFVQSLEIEEQKGLMLDVLNFVLDERVKVFYTSTLYRYFEEKYSKEELLNMIQKLLFGKYKILEIAYEFYDGEDNDERYPISKKQFKEVEENKYFIHPKRGDEISYDDFMKNTLLYFIPKRTKINEMLNV
jgi:hypothetical protein